MFGDLIVCYLFLGGAGAGLVSVLAAADLLFWWHNRSPERPAPAWTACLNRTFFARGYLVALVVLGLGAACLLVDLGQPERFFYVLTHPTASLLTFGSYVLVATMLCAAALGAIALFDLSRIPVALVHVLELVAVGTGLCTMAYTGLFLSVIDFVPLWNNLMLPVLFTASSLSIGASAACGLALVGSDMRPTPLAGTLARADAVIVAVEALCVAAYLALAAIQGASTAVEAFAFGENSTLFWVGFVCFGLALPLAIEVAYTRMNNAALLALAVPCVLVGGFILRYCIVNVPCI